MHVGMWGLAVIVIASWPQRWKQWTGARDDQGRAKESVVNDR